IKSRNSAGSRPRSHVCSDKISRTLFHLRCLRFLLFKTPVTRSESIEIPPSSFGIKATQDLLTPSGVNKRLLISPRNDATISKETENSPTIMQSRVKVKRHPFMAVCALAVLAAAGALSFNAHAACNIYMATNQQVIDGFGFSTAWCGTLTAAKNQSLYGTLGMSLMRVQIVNDVNGASDGAWDYEAADAAAAHSYGVKVFGTDWYGPSGWDDPNNPNPVLLPQYYGANALFLAQCAQYTHLDWLSPANEPDLGWQMWTTNEFVEWTAEYGASIGVPLMEPESCWFADP